MRQFLLLLSISALLASPRALAAQVVINEIMYNAPEEAGDVEYVELFNNSDQPVNLNGWEFSKGLKYTFQKKDVISAKGFLVLCRNPDLFQRYYQVRPAGHFTQKLSNDGETIELLNAEKNVADSLRYGDSAPWPLAADGNSSSLERISPSAPGNDPQNWAPSKLAERRSNPSGTPGARNDSFSDSALPVISAVEFGAAVRSPGNEIKVQAQIQGAAKAGILYYTVLNGQATSPEAVEMVLSNGKATGVLPGFPSGVLLRFQVVASNQSGANRIFPSPNEVRPAFGVYFEQEFPPAQIPIVAFIKPAEAATRDQENRNRGYRRRRMPSRPESTSIYDAALVCYPPGSQKGELFDFVELGPRKAGSKIKFHKDQLLNGLSTLNITYENEIAVVLEPLAYEVYRRAGNPTQQAFNLRLYENGQLLGLHLAFEQPNKTFLRRNKIRDDGNMYKLLWFGGDVVGQHEKKTNLDEGHEDVIRLVKVVEHLDQDPDAQWKVIEKQFDVPQVSTFFAVTTVLTHWDGFFNNYFTYHDINGSGKWTMYPWDQDQTFGFMNGGNRMIYNMPITFGMNGDIPPGQTEAPSREERFHFGRGAMWWRPPGFFSGPLLANPHFRKIFLQRTRELLETVFHPDQIYPLLDETLARLQPEVAEKAKLYGEDPKYAQRGLERLITGVKEQVKARRAFLLAEEEMRLLPKSENN